MAPKKKLTEPLYEMAPRFEADAAYLCCTDPKFLSSLGSLLQPDLMHEGAAKLAVRCAQSIEREVGEGPRNVSVAMQHAARLRDHGKLAHSDVIALHEFLEEFEDRQLPKPEDIARDVVALLRPRMTHAFLQRTIDVSGTAQLDGDWKDVPEKFQKVIDLGYATNTKGVVVSTPAKSTALEELRNTPRIQLGIEPIDLMHGGFLRQALICFAADTGGGKSMTLCHATGQSARAGRFVAYASFEMSIAQVESRVYANLTGIPYEDIERSSLSDAYCEEMIQAYPVFCAPILKFFEPGTITVAGLTRWVDQIIREDPLGRCPDMLVVDYADHLRDSTSEKNKDKNETHMAMRRVYEKLKACSVRYNMLVVTASQTTGRQDRRKVKAFDLHDTAGSVNKGRTADYFLTQLIDDTTREVTWFRAKNRHGSGRDMIGPHPTDLARCQLVPVDRPFISRPHHLTLVSSTVDPISRHTYPKDIL